MAAADDRPAVPMPISPHRRARPKTDSRSSRGQCRPRASEMTACQAPAKAASRRKNRGTACAALRARDRPATPAPNRGAAAPARWNLRLVWTRGRPYVASRVPAVYGPCGETDWGSCMVRPVVSLLAALLIGAATALAAQAADTGVQVKKPRLLLVP